jgi:membrane protease YdiL (CAAX protease family)
MDRKLLKKKMRSRFSSTGWAILGYFLLMRVCVCLVTYADVIYQSVMSAFTGSTEQEIIRNASGNAWGYLLCIGVGVLLMFLWKGRKFCTQELFARGRPMKVGDFFCLLAVFLVGQTLFALLSIVQELILNQFGFTALPAVQSATSTSETLSMFLYASFGAPIAEELLCRGLCLRPLVGYGKRFAVLMSAFFFGLMHCNIVQTPFAFVVGMVLGYVAVEYNILWAMVLHMINNLVISDLPIRLLGDEVGYPIASLVTWVLAVAGLIVLIRRRHEIRQYVAENKVDNQAVACFFTAPGVIAACAMLMYEMVTNFILMQ